MKNLIKLLIISAVMVNLVACAAFTEISSSTSTTSDAVTPDVTLNEFVNKRYVAIRHDAANGGGENLDALAQLMGENDKVIFAEKMQRNFDSIFMHVNKPVDIIARIQLQVVAKKDSLKVASL